MNKPTLVLFIFLIGIAIRFLYFPENVYFAYDAARDSYVSHELMQGDLKIVGPPSAASPNLFAGALLFYIYGPIYSIFGKNPENISFFMRIFNSLGIPLVYILGSKLFSKKVGLISAILFTTSFEQSQYSLFISHQALAVVSVLLFYLGLTMYLFENNKKGLLLTALGAGLSIQFHYSYAILVPIGLLLIFLHRKKITLNYKYILTSIFIFTVSVSTYILAEIKFGFRSLKAIGDLGGSSGFHLNRVIFIIDRFIHDNFLANKSLVPIILGLIIYSGYLLYKTKNTNKLLLLTLWLAGGLVPYFLTGTPSYYYGAASSISLIIILSWMIAKLFSKNLYLGLFTLSLIITSNFSQIIEQNPKGVTLDFVIQPGMLLKSEKKAIDYMYKNANGENFAVGGLTIPFNINTTWNYLFEWYGQEKYGYVPVWIGPTAQGYSGNLKVVDNRNLLPEKQFIIKEPGQGIETPTRNQFFQEESYFTEIVEETSFGTISIQKRKKI